MEDKHRAYHHRHQGDIEAYLHRQPGHHRIRHRLGNDYRSGGQPRDAIGPQPIRAA